MESKQYVYFLNTSEENANTYHAYSTLEEVEQAIKNVADVAGYGYCEFTIFRVLMTPWQTGTCETSPVIHYNFKHRNDDLVDDE